MLLRALLQGVTVCTMAGVLVIAALLTKSRKDKIVKAASPSLLYLILTGSLVLYSGVLLNSFAANRVTCMLLPWIRHVGFSITYGSLLIKTWRISVIMRMFTTKVTRTKDSQLFRAVGILILVTVAYMTIWTLTDPVLPTTIPVQEIHGEPSSQSETETSTSGISTSDHDTPREVELSVCLHTWWEYVISIGQLCFLIWGGTLCYQARKAPDMYNETRPISYAIWNEALWCVFYAYAASLLTLRPDSNMAFLLCFLRTQCTITVTLLVLFVPKFLTVFSTLRELRGTVSDVYGAKRIHRVSLLLSKNGAIKTVYCVPCGPLTYSEAPDDEDEAGDSESEAGDNVKENHYTKAEVDTLIEMVSRLKTEKNLYKTQVRRLYQLLKEYKHKIPMNGLPVCLVAETPDREHHPSTQHTYQLPTPSPVGDVSLHLPPSTPADPTHLTLPLSPMDGSYNPVFHDLASMNTFSTRALNQHDGLDSGVLDVPAIGCHNHNQLFAALSQQSRKASTVTSFLSSTPDNTSLNGDAFDLMDEEQRQRVALCDVSKHASAPTLTSPLSVYSRSASFGAADALIAATAAGNGPNQFSMTSNGYHHNQQFLVSTQQQSQQQKQQHQQEQQQQHNGVSIVVDSDNFVNATNNDLDISGEITHFDATEPQAAINKVPDSNNCVVPNFTGCSNSDDTDDDFPRLVQPQAQLVAAGQARAATAIAESSPPAQDIQDFISTICGKFGRNHRNNNNSSSGNYTGGGGTVTKTKAELHTAGEQHHVGNGGDVTHEMDTLNTNGRATSSSHLKHRVTTNKTLANDPSSSSDTALARTPATPGDDTLDKLQQQQQQNSAGKADKMSFVMYI